MNKCHRPQGVRKQGCSVRRPPRIAHGHAGGAVAKRVAEKPKSQPIDV